MAEVIPVFAGLDAVYAPEDLERAKERYEEVATVFKKEFGAAPDAFARSPGRVNLIGEHIDYEGYAVLPMAITKDTIVAIRKVPTDELVICNVQNKKYPSKTFKADPKQKVNVEDHSWANYFLAAYKGVHEYLNGTPDGAPPPTGLQVLVYGRVPTGSGLSSSSAFVCASSMALLGAYERSASKGDVAEFTCTCERHVGTESGGMDQAISIMAKQGVAKLVEFNPVRGTDVELPPGATFVVANSLAESNKAETADSRYNLRVVECQLASMILAQKLGASNPLQVVRLDQVEALVISDGKGKSASEIVKEHLHEGSYSVEEAGGIIGKDLALVFSESPSALRVLAKASKGSGFKLHDRALHVFQESKRVHDFRAICESGGEAEKKLSGLGELMTASHTSCRDLYECSCPELEELVGIAMAAGSLGSRLTGAGWGGCSVSLVKDEDVSTFIAVLKEKFFSKRVQSGQISEQDVDDCVFASKPSSGGAILRLGV